MNIMDEIWDLPTFKKVLIDLSKERLLSNTLSFTCIPKQLIMPLLYISIVVVSRSLSEDGILIGITLSCSLLVLHVTPQTAVGSQQPYIVIF